IGRSAVTPGALVTANQANALATVQQLDPIYVDLTQSNVDLLRLKRALQSGSIQAAGDAGTRVRLILEDGSAYPLQGTLQLAEASVDPGTGSVT
ncbi:efflux transporter periplasmic adaptor subunit, partial [Klebsiella quasipneumoniae]|nr:efflux transporter periplasmic adaptor subunit [Klebsiella quasipneumoniae]